MEIKQTELHRHLDVSTRVETLWELGKKQGLLSESISLQDFRDKIVIQRPMDSLKSVLAQFTFYQKIISRPEVLERIAFEGVEDCWNEGTRRVEFRYSPSFVSEYNRLPWQDAHEAFLLGLKKGIQKYPEMEAGLICIASRDFGPDAVNETVEFYLKNKSTFVGLDLAGNEKNFPCKMFEEIFKVAIREDAKITIHAGEAVGPENIWEAIELLGAKRIGHGVTCVQDPQLVDYLRKKQICLEQCPTSNWLTGIVPHFEDHPLPSLLRAGVPVCINTDDPSIFGVDLQDEIRICKEKMGMTEEEIQKCHANASAASFLPMLGM